MYSQSFPAKDGGRAATTQDQKQQRSDGPPPARPESLRGTSQNAPQYHGLLEPHVEAQLSHVQTILRRLIREGHEGAVQNTLNNVNGEIQNTEQTSQHPSVEVTVAPGDNLPTTVGGLAHVATPAANQPATPIRTQQRRQRSRSSNGRPIRRRPSTGSNAGKPTVGDAGKGKRERGKKLKPEIRYHAGWVRRLGREDNICECPRDEDGERKGKKTCHCYDHLIPPFSSQATADRQRLEMGLPQQRIMPGPVLSILPRQWPNWQSLGSAHNDPAAFAAMTGQVRGARTAPEPHWGPPPSESAITINSELRNPFQAPVDVPRLDVHTQAELNFHGIQQHTDTMQIDEGAQAESSIRTSYSSSPQNQFTYANQMGDSSHRHTTSEYGQRGERHPTLEAVPEEFPPVQNQVNPGVFAGTIAATQDLLDAVGMDRHLHLQQLPPDFTAPQQDPTLASMGTGPSMSAPYLRAQVEEMMEDLELSNNPVAEDITSWRPEFWYGERKDKED